MKPSEQVEFMVWNYLIGYGVAQVSRLIGIPKHEFLQRMCDAMNQDAQQEAPVQKPSLTVVH